MGFAFLIIVILFGMIDSPILMLTSVIEFVRGDWKDARQSVIGSLCFFVMSLVGIVILAFV